MILDVLLWFTFLVYCSGGVVVDGVLKWGWAYPLAVACGITYIALRLGFNHRVRDTAFGRAFYELMKQPLEIKKLSLPALTMGFVFVLSLILFFVDPILNHRTYGNYIWDFGVFENVIYNGAHSGVFFTRFLDQFNHHSEPIKYFPNNHLNFGLYFFSWIYKLSPHAEWLFFFQSLALVSAAFPLYYLAETILPKEIPPWVPVLLYVFWDSAHQINLWDFHETPFMIPFSLWAFHYIEKRKYSHAYLAMLAMAIWKEDAWVTFAAMSFYIGIRSQKWVLPSILAVGALAVLPLHLIYLNQVNQASHYYEHFGGSLGDVPSYLWRIAFRPDNQQFFLKLLLRTGGGVFLFGGWAVVPVLPQLLEIGLSESSGLLDWNNHYMAAFTGPLFYATLYGWKRVWPWLKFKREAWVGVSLALAFTQFHFREIGYFKYLVKRAHDYRCYGPMLERIPEGVPLVAEGQMAAQLSKREWIDAPQPARDQSWAQWMITRSETDLSSSWVVEARECGYIIAKRPDHIRPADPH